MDNPFEIIGARLSNIENLLRDLQNSTKENHPEADQILTIKEVAELVKLSVSTIYIKVSHNEIPFSKKGKRLYFSKAEIIDWIKEGKCKTHAEVAAQAHTYLKSKKK